MGDAAANLTKTWTIALSTMGACKSAKLPPLLSDGTEATVSSNGLGYLPNFDVAIPALNFASFQSQPSVSAHLDLSSAQHLYLQSLSQAHSRMSHVWEPATVLRRQKLMQELAAWLSQLPTVMGKSLATCSPADLLVLMEGHWLSHHGGTELPDGYVIASPSGVNSCLSHLSTGCSLIGRVAEWDSLTSKGNPVLSPEVSLYCQGYKKQAWKSGYLEGSAVPMQASKVHQLIDYLEHCIKTKPSRSAAALS